MTMWFSQDWLEALAARNNVAHSYIRAVAMDIVKQTKEKFLLMFEELQKELRSKWIRNVAFLHQDYENTDDIIFE